jgi:asparagine synthase (glutamine-hydrolysing)
MCGLTFSYHEGSPTEAIAARSRHALSLLKHRGPDEEGLVNGVNWAAGHCRLSIVDLHNSHQPMQDPSKRYTLVFNGEIYNFNELRTLLHSHWQFRTHGDTEVILAGLCIVGPVFLSKMQGMWAIAFWDNNEKQLLMARDRVGKKPLFYFNSNNCFGCASELKALAAIYPEHFEEDMDSTADYLRYGYYKPGYTAYKNIREVLPGHYLMFNPSRVPEEIPYWQLKLKKFDGTKQDAIDTTQSLLVRAVEKRMVADVEIGAFLSGGIDSSLITSILCKDLNQKIKTFTIGFTESSYDERNYARVISDLYGTSHFESILSEWDKGQLIDLIMGHVCQPFADSSILPTSLVSQLASRHLKVALTGDGSDELFSGYQRYQARILFKWFFRLPRSLRNVTKNFLNIFPASSAHHSRSIIKKAHLFLAAAERYADNPYDVTAQLYPSHFYKTLAPELADKGYANKLELDVANEDDVMQMMYNDVVFYLPQDILAKVDRASMAHSLETRCPFLDRDVIEHCFSLPRHWHRSGTSGKKILKLAFKDYLPPSIWKRRKQGFAVPIASWFRGSLGDELIRTLQTQHEPHINIDSVKTMILQHKNGIQDNSLRLWNIYVYLIWKNTKPWLL